MSSARQSKTKNWWVTLPGIITAIAALITAIGGFIMVLNSHNSSSSKTITSNDSIARTGKTVIIKDSSKVEGVIGDVSGKNVNVGANYGHVGDEYNGVKQRKVTSGLINKIVSLSPNKKFPIGVRHTATDPETMAFSNDLINQLKQYGYKTVNTAAMTILSDGALEHPRYVLAYPDTIFVLPNPDEFEIFIPAAKNYY